MPERFGVIGLGSMGRAMAARLLGAGHRVSGYDVDPAALARFAAAGGHAAGSAGDAAEGNPVVIVMVHDATQVDDVVPGLLGTMATGTTVWLASTVPPGYARALGERLNRAGIRFVDGPVSGGVAGAAAGRLTVIAGGAAEAVDAARGAMSACAARVFHVGAAGAGSAVKIVNQVLTAAHIALTAEALALGARCGVDPAELVAVIAESAGTSRQFETRAPAMLHDDHRPDATVRTFLKDLAIAQDTARALDFPTPLTLAAQQVFLTAAGLGHADDGDTTVVRVYETFGGVTVAGR